MKIKTKTMPFDRVLALPKPPHHKPLRPNIILSTAVRVLAEWDLLPTRFTHTTEGMEKLDPKEPVSCLWHIPSDRLPHLLPEAAQSAAS